METLPHTTQDFQSVLEEHTQLCAFPKLGNNAFDQGMSFDKNIIGESSVKTKA